MYIFHSQSITVMTFIVRTGKKPTCFFTTEVQIESGSSVFIIRNRDVDYLDFSACPLRKGVFNRFPIFNDFAYS